MNFTFFRPSDPENAYYYFYTIIYSGGVASCLVLYLGKVGLMEGSAQLSPGPA